MPLGRERAGRGEVKQGAAGRGEKVGRQRKLILILWSAIDACVRLSLIGGLDSLDLI